MSRREERIRQKYGENGIITHNSWRAMKERCFNKNSHKYPNYGGRGISICARWVIHGKGFENFLKDVGERPSKDHSLERIDVNKDYCPENCIWIESCKQALNKTKYKNNKTGVTGVSFQYPDNAKRFLAYWTDLDGIRRSKSFSIKTFGYEEAFKLACEYRKMMIEELVDAGQEYAPSHGEEPTLK